MPAGKAVANRRDLRVTLEQDFSEGSAAAGPADVELCRKAWRSIAGGVAVEAEAMFARNEHFFALLLLLEHVFGRKLDRWRIAFAEDGSSYRSTVWIEDSNGKARAYEGYHDSSMLRSMLAVVHQSACGPGRHQAFGTTPG
jgi:hypothetical protein